MVIADLLSNGVQVALPISEHLPFDCVAIFETNEMTKLSVKYRKKDKNGIVTVILRSSWSDRNGVHVVKHDKKSYDATAIYCPDTNKCYYIRNDEIGSV
jgi:hypothetical protein